jgi:HEPN domain-containing protein
MNTQISFSIYFEFASGLIALDKELDAIGCPIAYRKYLAVDWLTHCKTTDTLIDNVSRRIKELDLCVETVTKTWYNSVYGHVVYLPPASKLIVFATPIPVTATWSARSNSIILPDLTLIQFEFQDALAAIVNFNNPLFDGLKKFQALPAAQWVWLSMADYDLSVSSFELPRAAYHLSLWHTLQCIEKLLKAVLLAHGESDAIIRSCSHNISRIVNTLETRGISLTSLGQQLAKDIEHLVGGPGTRYVDDSNNREERLDLASRALEAHHLLLRFFASDCGNLGAKILSGRIFNQEKLYTHKEFSDENFRELVHLEHETMCSHSAYSAPPYAMPIRQNITYPINRS